MTKTDENHLRGTCWFNLKKANSRSPDFTGLMTIDGVERRVAAWWVADGEKGVKLSFTVYANDDSL